MTVDVSKIRVGDEVTIRMKVTALEDRDGDLAGNSTGAVNQCWFKPADIVAHVPKPRPLEPGDAVTWDYSNERMFSGTWFIIAVYGKMAWLRTPHGGYDDGERLMLVGIERLRHVDT